jgi:hypothetical protein
MCSPRLAAPSRNNRGALWPIKQFGEAGASVKWGDATPPKGHFAGDCHRRLRTAAYCNGGGVMPWNVVPRNFPCESKFQLNMASPARAQAWHPLSNG